MIYLRILLSILALMLLAACGQQNTPTPTPVPVDLSVRAEPQPLTVGETTLIVTLKDASGTPIDGAALQVHGDMDHEGMMPVDREVNASANGEYRVPFEWTMGGGWIVTVTAELPDNGGTISETFDFFVEAVSSASVINRPVMMHTDAAAEGTTDPAADAAVRIVYQPDHDPAIGGDATVMITLTDADDMPITDAAVEVMGNMAHHGMVPVTGRGEHSGAGQYVVPLRWTMAGAWQVTVKVTLTDGRVFEETYDQQVILRAN
jgi:hypothetical protein